MKHMTNDINSVLEALPPAVPREKSPDTTNRTSAGSSGSSSKGREIGPPRKLTQRQRRALMGLLAAPMTRERLDRVAGCSNAPQIVSVLRRKGISIDCVCVDATDRDGNPCRPGLYSLTPDGRTVAVRYLESE